MHLNTLHLLEILFKIYPFYREFCWIIKQQHNEYLRVDNNSLTPLFTPLLQNFSYFNVVYQSTTLLCCNVLSIISLLCEVQPHAYTFVSFLHLHFFCCCSGTRLSLFIHHFPLKNRTLFLCKHLS